MCTRWVARRDGTPNKRPLSTLGVVVGGAGWGELLLKDVTQLRKARGGRPLVIGVGKIITAAV